MMNSAEQRIVPFDQVEQLREAREVLRAEAAAVEAVASRLDTGFCEAVERLRTSSGRVVVTGMGKAGLVGRKIAATFSSTGTPSHFLHPSEGVHGDVGCVGDGDTLLCLSNSGETDEVLRLLPIVRRLGATVVGVTASRTSSLGTEADVVVELGRLTEAGPYGLAPTSSTTAMLAVGDALALVVARATGFTPHTFALYHPGGSLGRRLARVQDVMRRGDDLRIAGGTATIREVFVGIARPGRRTGAVMVVDDDGRLAGLFTDSDLARLLERETAFELARPIGDVMTRDPLTVGEDAVLEEVVEILSTRKFSELPVLDANRRPVGLVDITDVISLLPTDGDD